MKNETNSPDKIMTTARLTLTDRLTVFLKERDIFPSPKCLFLSKRG